MGLPVSFLAIVLNGGLTDTPATRMPWWFDMLHALYLMFSALGVIGLACGIYDVMKERDTAAARRLFVWLGALILFVGYVAPLIYAATTVPSYWEVALFTLLDAFSG